MLTVVSSSLFLFSGYQFYRFYQFYQFYQFSELCLIFNVLQYLLFGLFITSSIHHFNNAETNYKYSNIIVNIDKTLAHTISLISLCLSLYYKKILSFICLTYVVTVYYVLLKNRPLQPCLHCSIHVVSNIGLMLFLIDYF
jgi:hypothetical protein